MKYSYIVFIIALLSACKSNKDMVEPIVDIIEEPTIDEAEVEPIKPLAFTVSLREGACFGTCPVFTMTVNPSGEAIFKGDKFTDRLGTYTKQLTQAELDKIDAAYNGARIYECEDRYESNIPDHQMLTITVNRGRRPEKKIMFKENRPEGLGELYQVLHDIAYDESGWALEAGADVDAEVPEAEKADALVNQEELIIELESTTRVSRWFKLNKEKYGLFLIKKISPNSNYWLYSYDTDKFLPDEIIEKLNADPEVKTVQFNTTVENR